MATLKREMNTRSRKAAASTATRSRCRTVQGRRRGRARYKDVALEDKSSVFNTDLYQTLSWGR